MGLFYYLGWGYSGFGTHFFHVLMAVHEANYHGGKFVLCVDNHTIDRWPYPWEPKEVFSLGAQKSVLSCDETHRKLAQGGNSVHWHTMGFWNQPYSYSVSVTNRKKTSFSYWRKLAQSFLKPSPNVISSLRMSLGLSSSLRGVDCSRRKVFWEVFRDCIMAELFPEAGTNWSRPWVGVHVRAGDALTAHDRPVVQTQTLESVISHLPRKYSQGTVFLASDSQEVISQFGSRDGWKVVTMKVNRTKYNATSGLSIHQHNELNAGDIMIDLLLDLGLLSQADILLLPQYGSLSRLIGLMGKHDSKVVSSDGAFFCPYPMCEVGRTDDNFIEKGGCVSGDVRDIAPNVTVSQCYDDNFMLTTFNIPPEIVNFYRLPCLKRANLSREEYLAIAPGLLRNVSNIFADTLVNEDPMLRMSLGRIPIEDEVFQTCLGQIF